MFGRKEKKKNLNSFYYYYYYGKSDFFITVYGHFYVGKMLLLGCENDAIEWLKRCY